VRLINAGLDDTMPEQLEQLNEFLDSLGASVGRLWNLATKASVGADRVAGSRV
jgi:hypothetical protein